MDDVPGWTIEELARRATLALAGDASVALDGSGDAVVPSRAVNGRGRDVPDQRMIRWYASIGLVDRPIGGRGRGARYGVRHLSQLVAVKRLQASGLTLADVQARLLGADDEMLRALAGLPEAALAPVEAALGATLTGAARDPSAGASRSDVRFWVPGSEPPLEVVPAGPIPEMLAALRLAEGVVLVLPREPSPADLPALAEAAVPLLAALARLGIVPVPSPATTDMTSGAPR